MAANRFRREHDLLGERPVPREAYYGVHTVRALENFAITGTPISIYPDLSSRLPAPGSGSACQQRARALDDDKTRMIAQACEELRSGGLLEEFVVDVIQGGAGTSTNMNANEVIANRALELMGHRKGEYQYLHPDEHVN